MFENIRADYSANGRDWTRQGFWALLVYRFGRWRYGVRPVVLRKLLSILYKIAYKVVQILTGIELPCEASVGAGLAIDHFGGIIISGYARLGARCRIRTGVVIGLQRVDEPCAPHIGDEVDIGAGAKVLGAINIGDRVIIGANAVVISDVPEGHIAVGVPATCRAGTARRPHAATRQGKPFPKIVVPLESDSSRARHREERR